MPGGRAVWTRRTDREAGTGWTWSSECFQLVVVVTVCSCFMFDLVSGTCIRLEALLKLNSTGCDGCLMNIVFNCQDMFFSIKNKWRKLGLQRWPMATLGRGFMYQLQQELFTLWVVAYDALQQLSTPPNVTNTNITQLHQHRCSIATHPILTFYVFRRKRGWLVEVTNVWNFPTKSQFFIALPLGGKLSSAYT